MKDKHNWDQWADIAWVLGIGGQAGLMLAFPVLLALALGYLLDRWLNTLPWITLVFMFLGMIAGPFLVYRWVVKRVARRIEHRPTPPPATSDPDSEA